MRSALRRLQMVALVSFLPLAVIGAWKQRKALKESITLYYISILIFCAFLMCLAVYTYTKGGNFIPPMGTFY